MYLFQNLVIIKCDFLFMCNYLQEIIVGDLLLGLSNGGHVNNNTADGSGGPTAEDQEDEGMELDDSVVDGMGILAAAAAVAEVAEDDAQSKAP